MSGKSRIKIRNKCSFQGRGSHYPGLGKIEKIRKIRKIRKINGHRCGVLQIKNKVAVEPLVPRNGVDFLAPTNE